MQVTMLKSKIHRATVTQAELNYVGSITIDAALMEAAGIIEYERVLVVNISNGQRLETYAIAGDSGIICLNGAAARLACAGDMVIIMAWVQMEAQLARTHRPTVVMVGEDNKNWHVCHYESHGEIA